jgi:vesicle-fusing ATPase
MGPDTLVGLPELEKAREIRELFDDAYRSELSVIVLDDLEKLFEFIGVGPRFSNTVLQAIMVLAKKRPPHGHKLLVVATA